MSVMPGAALSNGHEECNSTATATQGCDSYCQCVTELLAFWKSRSFLRSKPLVQIVDSASSAFICDRSNKFILVVTNEFFVYLQPHSQIPVHHNVADVNYISLLIRNSSTWLTRTGIKLLVSAAKPDQAMAVVAIVKRSSKVAQL